MKPQAGTPDQLVVGQPADAGGQDSAPTPTELFVASLATCVAFYAGRFLTRHGYSRDGLAVSVGYEMATNRPARVSGIRRSSSTCSERLGTRHVMAGRRWAALTR